MNKGQSTYLGALLHDIGKFQFRALPTTRGLDHETLGEGFIKSSLMNFKIFESPNELQRLVEYSKRSSSAVKRADIHSAAGEREKDGSSQTRRPLISVFSRIDINKSQLPEGVYYYEPDEQVHNPIHITGENVSEWKPDEQHFIEKHQQSYKEFIKDVALLSSISDFKSFFSSFYSIMEKWTSRVSSAGYYSVPDISLFDHSRVVTALASCYEESDNEQECLLIKGDISGIQNFIFKDIESVEAAAKTLRGRSFYIKLLSDAIVSYILNELDLYEANVFYNSGGHFVLIVPNNKKNNDKIEEIEKYICSTLFNKFEEHLQVIIARHSENGQIIQSNFDAIMQKLDEKLNYEKKRKSFSILPEIMSNLLSEDGINAGSYFENIGSELPTSSFLLEIQAKNINIDFGNKLIGFKEFGLFYLLTNYDNLEKSIKKLEKEEILRIKVINLENSDFSYMTKTAVSEKIPIGYAFHFHGSYIPLNSDYHRPMTFEELSKLNTETGESLSFPSLGFLRMDVDSLGKVFRFGFDKTKGTDNTSKLYTISRAASLSREMDLFFSYEIRNLAKENDIYLVYSGGDDLFAVSSWKNIIDFSQKVRTKFSEYTCNNGNLTLSAGTLFVNSSFPISRAGKLAGDFLDAAKSTAPELKDRINIFNRNLTWKSLNNLLLVAKGILNILDNSSIDKKKTISRSSLYNLLTLTKRCINNDGSLNIGAVSRTISKIHYFFARNHVDSKELENKKLGFKTTLAEYFLKNESGKNDWYENFIVPASYVLMITRSSINK